MDKRFHIPIWISKVLNLKINTVCQKLLRILSQCLGFYPGLPRGKKSENQPISNHESKTDEVALRGMVPGGAGPISVPHCFPDPHNRLKPPTLSLYLPICLIGLTRHRPIRPTEGAFLLPEYGLVLPKGLRPGVWSLPGTLTSSPQARTCHLGLTMHPEPTCLSPQSYPI